MLSAVRPSTTPRLQSHIPDVRGHSKIMLQCPLCGGSVTELQCLRCAFKMELQHGIVRALPPGRMEHYAKFMLEYERIRAAEGRGSMNSEYYLGLPYKDTTGNNSQQWTIRAKSYDFLVQRILKSELNGRRILDLGAGNCWMSFRLAQLGCLPFAVDLLINDQDGLGAAKQYHAYLPQPIPRFQAEVSRLPFADAQFDFAIFNASFHYSEDYEATLLEVLRCLKEDGLVIICDTPWYSREESGTEMVAERCKAFYQRFGTASHAIQSQEFLTDGRLRSLEQKLSLCWNVYRPWYGWSWAMRPLMAGLKGRREPSRFRIYTSRKHADAR